MDDELRLIRGLSIPASWVPPVSVRDFRYKKGKSGVWRREDDRVKEKAQKHILTPRVRRS